MRILASFLLLLATNSTAQSGDFTIVVLPDTQHYSRSYPHIFNAQTKWIAENASRMNIGFVVGVGDIVNNGEQHYQWQNADAAVRVLDNARIPYVMPLGNHDYMYSKVYNRDTRYFNQYFGPLRYSGYSWYRGNYPSGTNDNFYTVFDVNGIRYLVLALETYPRRGALDWAAKIIAANQDKRVILTTHSFLYKDNTRVGFCDHANAEDMGVGGDNDGDETWARLASRHPNIFMVLSGHVHGVGRRSDLGGNGNRVNQILADYQHEAYGGGGYLRILKIRPSLNVIEVSTYSPYYNRWRTDSGNQFTVQMNGPGGGLTGSIAGTVRNGDCNPVKDTSVSGGGVSTLTSTAGTYSLTLAAPHTYTASATASGLARKDLTLKVLPSLATQGEFFLRPARCPDASVLPAVSICTPYMGDSIISPVRVLAYGSSSNPVMSMRVYVDGSNVYSVSGGKLDSSIRMSEGSHRLTVQAVDSAGTVFKRSVYVSVDATSSTGTDCTLSTTNQSITICSPWDGSSVSGAVTIRAYATDSSTVRYLQVYLNGAKKYEVLNTRSLETSLSLAPGTHRMTVQAGNSLGALYKKTVYVTVTD